MYHDKISISLVKWKKKVKVANNGLMKAILNWTRKEQVLHFYQFYIK